MLNKQATNNTHDIRLKRARLSLEGLSIGDGLGAFFEMCSPDRLPAAIKNRTPPDTRDWYFTDDTNMALSIYAILRQHGQIEQDALAAHFAEHFTPLRGYGMGARRLIKMMKQGADWREISKTMFRGGSYGNGGAMRVAPVGAYFADDMDAVIKNAALSAQITHAHPEGIAGAIAVAVAAAHAWRLRNTEKPSRPDFINMILPHIPDSDVRKNCERARNLADGLLIRDVVQKIGNGFRVTAQDTVPFVLYCAGEFLHDYEEAIWQTASGGGDVDTTCAMVGGITVMFAGENSIPDLWRKRREALPEWAFIG